MKKANVYIHGRAFYSQTRHTFEDEHKYQVVTSLDDAEICVWTGGEDIFPGIYGEKPMSGVHYSASRDKSDLEAIKEATSKGKFLVGICRGAQLLNCIPNGGRLWQDVDNHGGRLHRTFDCLRGVWVNLNSVHHQGMRVAEGAQILAWAQESTERFAEGIHWGRPVDLVSVPETEKDIEAVWYPKTKSLCVQFHPEFGHPLTTNYFFSLMDTFYWRKQA